jgi:hypothetical protein
METSTPAKAINSSRPEGVDEPLGQRGRFGDSARALVLGGRDGDRREEGDAEGASDLLRRVDQSRGEAGLLGFVPASAAIVIGTNANGIATPSMRKPGKRSAQYEPSTETG